MSRKKELVLLVKCGAILEVGFPFCDMQRRQSTETTAGEVPSKLCISIWVTFRHVFRMAPVM